MILNFDKSHRVCWVRWHLPFRVPCANFVGRKKSKVKKIFFSLLFFLWKGNFSNFCKCGINHLSFSRPNDCRQDEKKNLCKKSFCPNFCLWFSKVYLNKWEKKCMLCWCFQIQQTCIVAKDHDGNFCRICVVRKKNKNVKKTQKKKF